MAEKIRDILHVPDIKLVVELDDADRDSSGIKSSFVLTQEVEQGLKAILQRINDNKGCGVFIKGNFGSGKSHFLSYLYLLLRNKTFEGFHDLKDRTLKISKISLVKYPAHKSLEEIVLDSFHFKERRSNRADEFKEIVHMPTIIIIDELSEFLLSKPTPSAFYEDIRFLQFLGEFSFHYPLWIVASLQEWIEETGHISSSIFNRIKDRYPLRLNLTASHIEDIIDRRIIIKKEGANAVIERVFKDLKSYYPNLTIKYEDFRKTYPLHPFTVRYLIGLTQVFSQQRGVIQFVFNEMQKHLESPPDLLITPDRIYDHFEDRIREIPEFSSFARVVFDYYKTHINEIFNREKAAETAKNIIKILILTEITPLEKRKTAKEIAELSLKKISTFSSQINYEFISKAILEPLVSHQMYIRKESDVYFIDASVDEGIKIKGKIKKIKEKFEDKNYLFKEICNLTMLPYLPLKDLLEGKKFRVGWQNSLRDFVVSISTSITSISDIERMLHGLEKRLDGFLIILSPFIDNAWIGGLKNNFSNQYLSCIAFWVPVKLTTEELVFIEEFTAKHLLSKDISALRNDIKKEEALFKDIITRLYFHGSIIFADGFKLENLNDMGLIPLERMLLQIADYCLTKIYPEYHRIMPRTDYISVYNMNLLYYNFIKQGKISVEEADKKGITNYIRGFLEPLGLVIRRGKNYLIAIDVSNEIVSHVLNLLAHEDNLSNIRLSLKKGRWGMTDEQISLILSTFIVLGHIVPYSKDEIVELKELSQLSSGEIARICRGKVIPADILSHIHKGAFIWGETEDVPTPLSQRAMWKDAVGFIRQNRSLIDDINSSISRYKDYTIFKKIALNMSVINSLSNFLSSMSLSLPPSEGLEKILFYFKEYPDIEQRFAYLQRLHRLFNEEFQYLNKYYIYLTHPSLKLPENLEDKRNRILIKIDELLKTLGDNFLEIKVEWEDFFRLFLDIYKESHELFYGSDVFKLRQRLDEDRSITLLKKVANNVSSITYQWEWWQIKRELDRLPETCRADIDHELFSNPICKCRFQIGDNPPTAKVNLQEMGRVGLLNFIETLRLPENREKLDSFLIGFADEDLQDTARKIHMILTLNIEKTEYSLIHSLLTDEVLQVIEKVFKGRWKIKELKIDEFIDKIKGRRFKYEELKDLMLQWLGGDEESIIHVLDESFTGESVIKEEFAKYGVQGERLFIDLSSKRLMCGRIDELEEKLKETGKIQQLDSINMTAYTTKELLHFLANERIEYLKKKIRHEIFYRFKDRIITTDSLNDFAIDDVLKDLLNTLKILSQRDRFSGVKMFTEVIAPSEYLIEKLFYKSLERDSIDRAIVEYLDSQQKAITKKYSEDINRYEGAVGVEYLKNVIEGNVVILDGLRYDLWFKIRNIFQESGWKLKEKTFFIDTPSTTDNFRKLIGMDYTEIINGKRFKLTKFTERNIGRREIRKLLKGGEDIKFLHFNFIDAKVHNSVLDIYPLYEILIAELKEGIMPLLRDMGQFYLVSDHGFIDTKKLKDRYEHGKGSIWEVILPFVHCS